MADMLSMLSLFAAAVCALVLVAFCAGLETAFFSVSRGRVLHLAREGSVSASIVHSAFSDMTSTLTSLLVGNNLAAVVFSSSSAALSARFFPESGAAQAVWSVAAAFIVLYLGEFLPKLLCSMRPLRRIVSLAKAFRAFSAILSPLTAAGVAVTNLFDRGTDLRYKVTANDLLRILKDRKDGVKLSDFESALVSRILVLRKKGEAITPESLMSALDEDWEEEKVP
jgi:CBS domain containing-hemolysin-like protein